MKNKKIKTYMDSLMLDKEFKESFELEYQNLSISEQIARVRKAAHLTQAELARQVHTTKSAISRYESANYNKYSISLLSRIARSCNANLKVILAPAK